MTFIDIHTHQTKHHKHAKIVNLFTQDINSEVVGDMYSVGLHPWFVNADTEKDFFSKLESKIKNSVAVGEIGLDRAVKNDFELQKHVFEKQLILAEKYDKAVIIHAVKTFSELMFFRKKYNKTSWIFHAFAANEQIAEHFLAQNCYFSFGLKQILHKKFSESMRNIPLSRIFFETDEEQIDIQDVYRAFAEKRNIVIAELHARIRENFRKVFKTKQI